MSQHSTQETAIANPTIEPFRVLIGNWNISGTHPMVPNTTVSGRTSFEWLENGAFLMMQSEVDDPRFPNSIAIFGSDDLTGEYFMLYFDERRVSRKYKVTLQENIWKMWRNAPGFSQRFTGTIVNGGNTIIGTWELSKDDSSWEKDLELTYQRGD